MAQIQEPSTWTPLRVHRHIDPVLLNDKRLEISQEMQVKSNAARNSANNPAQWAAATAKLTDEWAERLFAAWLEIWEIQGLPKCHALYRAIFECELIQLFAVRRACFQGECKNLEMVKRQPHYYSAALGWFAREMKKLASKWNRRMDVESRKALYAARQEQTAAVTVQSAIIRPLDASGTNLETQVGAIATNFTWKELEIRFRELHAKTEGQRVSTDLIRTQWNSGSVTEEWIIGGNAVWRTDFEALASIAARKLGYSQSEGATEHWLDRVWEWMQQRELDKDKKVAWLPTGTVFDSGRTGTTGGMCTDRIADLSAMLCMEMIARGTRQSAVLLGLAPSEIARNGLEPTPAVPVSPAVVGTNLRKERKSKVLTSHERRRRSVIFGAIEAGYKGRKYAAQLSNQNLLTPPTWRAEGCPDDYKDAYAAPEWKPRIWDEKNRFQEQYDNTPPAERKAIIEGRDGTRRTRR